MDQYHYRLPRACEKCTRNKRKCDKATPHCGRCLRLDVQCRYDDGPASEAQDAGSCAGPGAVDLICSPANSQLGGFANVFVQLEPVIKGLRVDWHQVLDRFFQTVHHWFSIINKQHFQESLLPASTRHDDHDWLPRVDGEETLLLCLCMYLATYTGNDGALSSNEMFSSLYRVTKQTFAVISCLSRPTVKLIQCGALIALYEFAHGRARFAYRTLSETHGMARTAGVKAGTLLEDRATVQLASEEEKRNLWWGLFILDQYIHLDPAASNLPLIVESPSQDTLIPTESGLWDGHSYSHFSQRLAVNAPLTIDLGTFQRAAQAATILHRAHLWSQTANDSPTDADAAEAEQLDGAIRVMLDACLAQAPQWEVFCDAFAMCMSSLLMLYRPYIVLARTASPETRKKQARVCVEKAIPALKFAIRFMEALSVNFNSFVDQHPDWLANLAPPATITSCQALEYVDLAEDVMKDEESGSVEIYKSVKVFIKRWRVGEVVLNGISQQSYVNEWIANVENTL